MGSVESSLFWDNIMRAAEADPRRVSTLRGASGFSHPVVAIGVDEPRRRLVIVSGEGDARSAAMAQGDIQAVMPSVRIVMVRPVAVNLGFAAKLISDVLGRIEFGQKELDWLTQHQEDLQERIKALPDEIGENLKRILVPSFSAVPLSILGVFKDALQQLSLVEMRPAEGATSSVKGEARMTAPVPTFDLRQLAVLDPAEADRRMGVCSLPLYELSPAEVESLTSKPNDDEAREVLKRHDVLQYFFPAPDQLALGLADREPTTVGTILDRLHQTPEFGHPFGAPEIIDSPVGLADVVAALREHGLMVEGETSVEITPEGRTARAKVVFKPREGLISKLLQRFSLNVDLNLKDLFKG